MKIYFNNKYYDQTNFSSIAEEHPSYLNLVTFIGDWLNNESVFEFQTSGSTGSPKKIKIFRHQIEASVQMTKTALNLETNDRVLVCLNPEYIATIMMIARCLILDLDIVMVTAKSNPFEDIPEETKIDFASFVPFQIERILNLNESLRLEKIRNILIGGAAISSKLQERLSMLQTNIYQSYGMTETVSHIALMNLTNSSNFRVLEGVEINQDHRGCLSIKSAVTNKVWLQTNDIVEFISNKEFSLKGRADQMINSGGIKIFPEELEKLTRDVLTEFSYSEDFFFHGVRHDELGEKVAIVFENKLPNHKVMNEIENRIIKRFSKYHTPKKIYLAESFIRTESGKLKRKPTFEKAHEGKRL